MKLSKIFVAIMALCAVVACNPENKDINNGDSTWSDSGSPVGEWVLSEWNGSKDLPMGVYLRLNENNTFDLYQHTSNVLWVHYSGTFSLNGSTLTGKYADGTDWAEYNIKYNNTDNTKQIQLTRTGDMEDVAIYSATEIPAEVIDQSSEATQVRSIVVDKFL